MYPRIISFSNNIAITSYGLCLVLGLCVFAYFFINDKNNLKNITNDHLSDCLCLGIIAGLTGGRILWAATEQGTWTWWELLMIWEGGLCVLGAIAGVIIALTAYLTFHKLPLLPFLDRIALYTPLFHSIARIGCFLGGCCYGKPYNGFFAVTYQDPYCNAPLGISLHSSQLYSCIMLLGIFLLLYSYIAPRCRVPGQLLYAYLGLAGIERCINEMFRGDCLKGLSLFSLQQTLALAMTFIALAATAYLTFSTKELGDAT